MKKKCKACKGKRCEQCNQRGYIFVKKTKTLSKSQERKIVQKKQYSKSRKEFLLSNLKCMVLGPEGRCTNRATEIHHRKGRVGSNLLNQDTWMAVCESCHHGKIHGQHRGWAQRMGYMINRASENIPPISNEFIPYD